MIKSFWWWNNADDQENTEDNFKKLLLQQHQSFNWPRTKYKSNEAREDLQASAEARKMQVTKEEKAATKEKIDNRILNIEKAFVARNIAQGILKGTNTNLCLPSTISNNIIQCF